MYPRQEASHIRQEFWTTFGQYMAPVPSAAGDKINWINYKTGEQHIQFRMEADNQQAIIAIVLTHNILLRELYYEQFTELKPLLHAVLNEEWTWVPEYQDGYGKIQSRIFATLNGVSIFRKEDWQEIIRFFKQRIIALDEFWNHARLAFEALK